MPSMTATIVATAVSIAATPVIILARSSSVSDGARCTARQQKGAAANRGQGGSQVVPKPIERIERALGVSLVICTHRRTTSR